MICCVRNLICCVKLDNICIAMYFSDVTACIQLANVSGGFGHKCRPFGRVIPLFPNYLAIISLCLFDGVFGTGTSAICWAIVSVYLFDFVLGAGAGAKCGF